MSHQPFHFVDMKSRDFFFKIHNTTHILFVLIINLLLQTVWLCGLFVSTKQVNFNKFFNLFNSLLLYTLSEEKQRWEHEKKKRLTDTNSAHFKNQYHLIGGGVNILVHLRSFNCFHGNYSNWHRHSREIETHAKYKVNCACVRAWMKNKIRQNCWRTHIISIVF